MRPLAMRPLASGVGKSSTVVKRSFASVIQTQSRTPAQRIPSRIPTQSFKRSYADGYVEKQAPVTGKPSAPKKKRAGFFRWTWRLLYVSAIAGIGYTAYGIYVNRNPVDQKDPDPNKKTLVVLGKWDIQVGGEVLR